MIRIWRVSKVRLRSAKCADQLSDLKMANHTSESECCRKTRKWKWSWKFYWTNHLKIVTHNAQRLHHMNQPETQCNLKMPALCLTAVALLSLVRSLGETVSRFMAPSHSQVVANSIGDFKKSLQFFNSQLAKEFNQRRMGRPSNFYLRFWFRCEKYQMWDSVLALALQDTWEKKAAASSSHLDHWFALKCCQYWQQSFW